MNTLTLKRTGLAAKTLYVLVALAAAVILPQLLHLIGLSTGNGAGLGETFLPMHLPVLMIGFLAGAWVGGTVGLLAPLVSFALTGMPQATMLPNMMVELAVYGIVSGLLAEKEMPLILKVLITLVAGRLAKLAVIFLMSNILHVSLLPIGLVSSSIITGLPGIIIQLIAIPLIFFLIKQRNA